MKPVFTIHSLEHFMNADKESGIYVSDLRSHLERHQFIRLPHKHDFYFMIICTRGSGRQEIDFRTYNVKPGSVYFMYPGQAHRLLNCREAEGYVLFHTRDFYDLTYNSRQIRDYPFFYCTYNTPLVELNKAEMKSVEDHFTELLNEYRGSGLGKYQKLCSLIDLMYIDLSRKYLHAVKDRSAVNVSPSRIRQFEELLDRHFAEIKSPAAYAGMMHITPKQLNRICHNALGKTTTGLIVSRVLLEAKRMLVHDTLSIAEVAASLGYFDTGYFTRIFRKNAGVTPAEFVKNHRVELTAG